MDSLWICALVTAGISNTTIDGAQRPPDRLGQITIYGNLYTDQARIREVLRLSSGQHLPTEGQLLGVEIRMLKTFGERFVLKGDEGPLLTLEPSKFDSRFADLTVTFPERRYSEAESLFCELCISVFECVQAAGELLFGWCPHPFNNRPMHLPPDRIHGGTL